MTNSYAALAFVAFMLLFGVPALILVVVKAAQRWTKRLQSKRPRR